AKVLGHAAIPRNAELRARRDEKRRLRIVGPELLRRSSRARHLAQSARCRIRCRDAGGDTRLRAEERFGESAVTGGERTPRSAELQELYATDRSEPDAEAEVLAGAGSRVPGAG